VILANNSIETLIYRVFKNNKKLEVIDLQGNKIKMLNIKLFLNLAELQVVDFRDNEWLINPYLVTLFLKNQKKSYRNAIKIVKMIENVSYYRMMMKLELKTVQFPAITMASIGTRKQLVSSLSKVLK
jgi:hypothetical protein